MVVTEAQIRDTGLLLGVYAGMTAGDKAHATLVSAALDAFRAKKYSAIPQHLSKLPDSVHRQVGNTQIASADREIMPCVKAVCVRHW
ncbi:MAG: hypothetical protein WCX64_06590 [Candidatus Micrarchaeia archaeon]